MILKEHKKHSAIARPANGNFSRNEWAILGGPCSEINRLAYQIIAALAEQYQCAYADTSHKEDLNQLPGKLVAGAALDYSDQVNYQQLSYKEPFTSFEQRALFAQMDMVLVNGNHQQAKAQVVIIDADKKASLQRRAAQLTNVQMILFADGNREVFDFVKQAVPNWQELPVFNLHQDLVKIIAFFRDKLKLAKPPLNGLVLAGGRSVRMGADKGHINWFGKGQRYYMADLLKNLCNNVFISCRDEQQKLEIDSSYSTIADTFTGLGPYGAILSAFREQPDAAWLVVACDLPLVDERTLSHLSQNRDARYLATAYHSGVTGFPEPLITIWEPKAYPVLLQYLAQGYSCPRKVLINSAIHLLDVPNPDALANVNTSEEMERVKKIIDNQAAPNHAS